MNTYTGGIDFHNVTEVSIKHRREKNGSLCLSVEMDSGTRRDIILFGKDDKIPEIEEETEE